MILVFFANTSFAAVAPIWSAEFKEAVKWTKVTESGILLVGTNSSISGVDPDNGQVLWTREDIKKTAPFNTREVVGTPIVLVNDYSGMGQNVHIYAINQVTGQDEWQSEPQQGMPIGVYPFKDQNVAIVFFTGWTKEEGNGVHVQALELTTGKKLWDSVYAGVMSSPVLHVVDDSGMFYAKVDLSGHQDPIVQGDNLYIPFKGMDCYNIKTGEKKWSVPFKTGIPLYKKAYAAPVIEGDTLFASGYGGVVYAFNKENGEVKWKSKGITSGQIAQLTIADNMILARIGGFFYEPGSKSFKLDKPLRVLAFNKTSGEELWEYKNLDLGMTNLLYVPALKVVALSDGNDLIGLNSESTGKAEEKFKLKLDFTRKVGASEMASAGMKVLTAPSIGGLLNAGIGLAGSKKNRMDVPVNVSLLDNGSIVVKGKQHVMAFDPAAGKLLWTNYFPAPGAGVFEIAIMTALTFTSSWGYQAGAASGSMSTSSAENGLKKGWADYDKMVQKRFSSSKAGEKYSYILTVVEEEKKKGLGVIAVNLATGNVDQQFMFGEKQPNYNVDEVVGKVFHVKKKVSLEAYTLK